MKRLALAVAAAAILGSGCIYSSSSCSRTITVAWPQFQAADGTLFPSTVAGCANAAIVAVDVFMNDTLVDRFACSDGGVTITGVPGGTHIITVEGIEASNRIAFRDDFNVDASSCGDHAVTAFPAEGALDLQYHFTPTDVCVANPSYIWFSIYDQIALAVTAEVGPTSSVSDQTSYVCGDTTVRPTVFRLPFGPYTVRWVEETVQTGPTTFAVTATNCSPAPGTVQVLGATTVPFPVSLVDSSVACPP